MTAPKAVRPKRLPKAERQGCSWKHCRADRLPKAIFCVAHLQLTVSAGMTNPFRLPDAVWQPPARIAAAYRKDDPYGPSLADLAETLPPVERRPLLRRLGLSRG